MRRENVRGVSLRLLLLPLLLWCGTLTAQGQTDSTKKALNDSLRRQESMQGMDKNVNGTVKVRPEAQTSNALTPLSGAGGFQGAFSGNVPAGGMMRATLGATVGGAQDIGYTRQLIEQGRVPSFIDFSPEGLYSEHDIPTPESECKGKLCLSLGYGFAPAVDTKQPALFVHLGMTSGVRPEDFHRPKLQLALVIDKSGSMEGKSMEAVKKALRSLIDKLGPDDVVTLIAFNEDAELILPPTSVSDKEKILAAIDGLAAAGGTDIEAGLSLGFGQLEGLKVLKDYQKRLMLFTDARPNSGRTDSGSFASLTKRYADQGIGLTAFGVGLDFGQQLTYQISQLRGGNFFFLESPEKIAKVFDTEFDYLVTPIVYDLNISIKTPDGLKLTAVYGLPTWEPGDRDAELHVPTVFFSSNRGAIILRYERDDDAQLSIKRGDILADGSLSYTDIDGKEIATHASLRHNAKMTLKPGMQFYTHEGMRTAVALTNVYLGLRDGCTLFTEGKKEEALSAIAQAKLLVDLENVTLLDAGLRKEVALLDKLAQNIDADTPTSPRPTGDPEKMR